MDLDSDVLQMSPQQLVAEVRKLRQGVRAHRDSGEPGFCRHHSTLWRLLPEQPEQTDAPQAAPTWPNAPSWPDELLRGWVRYRRSQGAQGPDALGNPFR